MAELTFHSDTKHRKDWFTDLSFSHPAKMILPLELWLIEKYTKPGDVILDPMAGSGTLLVACSLGRDVVLVELEQKFVEIQKGNWAKIQRRGPQMGYSMGCAAFLQGDARNLEGLLVDKCIFSPPYASTTAIQDFEFMAKQAEDYPARLKQGLIKGHARGVKSEREWLDRTAAGQIEHLSNIGNLPYGQADRIITSPPYEGSIQGIPGIDWSKMDGGKRDMTKEAAQKTRVASLSGYTDAIITSPPYEGTISDGREKILSLDGTKSPDWHPGANSQVNLTHHYGRADNIGNLKNSSYLEAMLTVYRNCFGVLKPGGIMALVTKNFIRDKKVVRLDLDTIALCEKAGFKLIERHYRKLTQVSFWRTIYAQKYPDAPVLDTEDVLIFEKG